MAYEPYEKQTWVDGTTPIDAEHMNHIEDGIKNGEANSYFVIIQEGVSVTKEFLSDINERGADGINIVGVTPGGPSGLLYSNSFKRSTQMIGGTLWTTLVFKFLDDRNVESGERMFGYQSMSAMFRSSDDPSTEYEWDVGFTPIVQASGSEKVALTAPATVNDGVIAFGRTWQELHDGNYVAVVIETDSGEDRLPIVSVGNDSVFYYVKFIMYDEAIHMVEARAYEPDSNPAYSEK